ncbi:single-stranded DNA-binding protein [Microbacterium algeriense]|uniref:single-stranded DNA-binding protein n=1 Tax=Microbacterium algeriense TaxID=2615184 RepID=UPI003D713465
MSIKTIVGRLGADTEVRMTQGGKAVASFSVAETKRKFNRDTNQWEDDFTIWHDVESWQNTDSLGALAKGELVIVLGEERDASYQHRETGKTVRRIVVRAQSVGVLVRDGRNGTSQATGGGYSALQASGDTWTTPGTEEAF